jgi:hypothetical protein
MFLKVSVFPKIHKKNVVGETDTLLCGKNWIEDAENTGFVYQDCNFINLLFSRCTTRNCRPLCKWLHKWEIITTRSLNRTNKKNTSNKISFPVPKSSPHFDKIIFKKYQQLVFYSVTGKLIVLLVIKNSNKIYFLG